MTLFYFETCSNIFQSDRTLEKSFRALFFVFYPHIYKSHCILCLLTEPNLGKTFNRSVSSHKKVSFPPHQGEEISHLYQCCAADEPYEKGQMCWTFSEAVVSLDVINTPFFMPLCYWILLKRLFWLTESLEKKARSDRKGTFTSSHLHSQ